MIDLKIKNLMTKDNVTREEIQQLSVDFANEYNYVWLRFATGLGKARCLGLIGDKKKVLCVCQMLIHIQNFKEDLDKFNIDYSNWTFTTYLSFHKHIGDYDLIGFDEGDSITENTLNILKKFNYKQLVVLTADANISKEYLIKSIIKQQWKITFKLAQKWGLIPKAKITCVKVNLTDKYYKTVRGRKYSEKAYLTHLLDLIEYYKEQISELNLILKKSTEEEKNTNLTKEEKEEFQKKHSKLKEKFEFTKIKMFRVGGERKRLFNDAKFSRVKEIWEEHKHRSITFVGSIKETAYFPHVIHSKNKNNQELIDKFNSEEIDSLATVNILVRGQNIKSLKYGILGTFTSDGIMLLQSLGRLYRGKMPEIFILYVSDSKNEEDLQRFIKKHQLEVIWK